MILKKKFRVIKVKRPEHFLLDLVAAVLDDPLHLLVDQLHTAETWLLQSLDLSLNQQLEADL